MTTFFMIHKKELDYDEEVKAQLDSMAEQIEQIDDEYSFLPQEEYTDTFVWVLQSNHIPYRLSKPLAQ